MAEKLNHMTYAELPHAYDAWKYLATGGFLGHDFYADDPEIFQGLKNGRRNTEVQASLYDAMMAEIMDERNAGKAKVRNRRRADRKHPENKAERKKEKQNRMHRLYGLAYEDTKYGKTVFFWDKKEGQKKFPEYEAEIFRNMKERSAEKIAREDWEIESAEIELDAEFNIWAQKIEDERLHEWLKYA